MWHVTASHVATFSVCSCREKCKSFLKDLNRAELSLFKALCFDMIILNLFCTIVANLKCIRTAFSLHTAQFISEGIWTTLDCCVVADVAFDAGKSVRL